MMNSKKLKMIFGGTILASAIMLNSVNAVVTSSTFIKGDVTRDGKITSQDYDKILAYVKKTDLNMDDEQKYLADVNEDGNITLIDATKILASIKGTKLRYIVGDINRDGKVTQDDADTLYNHISGTNLLDEEQFYLADLFSDEKVNLKDYNRLLEILNGTYKRYEMGDVNRDGKLTQDDADDIMKYFTGKISFDDEQKILGDVDGDGKINARDAKLVLQNIVANTPKGDLDYNGVVDANDASVALELYKAQNATSADIGVGDMDNNNLIDANDASLILEVYKTNN